MLKGMVGSKPSPTFENLGQIADGLGLNAVLMQLPSAHLGRLSLPAVLELRSRKVWCWLQVQRSWPFAGIDPS